MAISFVNPAETRRLDLSGGDWIEVRDRLPFGSGERLRAGSLKSMSGGAGETKFDMDLSTYNLDRMVAYIVGWSARRPDGSPAKAERDSFAALTEETAQEIRNALDAHIEARAEEAKQADGNPTAIAIDSPSWSAVG